MSLELRSRALRIADWTFRILLALAFLSAGVAKVAGASQMVALFEQIGIGQWFRFFTGIFEIAGGLMVLLPRSAVHGAGLLACTMAGAIFIHLAFIGGNPLPAVILMILCIAVLWLRKGQMPRIRQFEQ